MSSLKFSISSLTRSDAQVLADAYYRSDKDLFKMSEFLDCERIDANLLYHPLVKAEIVRIRNEMNEVYTLKDHLEKLKMIRDGAMGDENWKVALSAEVAVGKAAGLYEPKPTEDADLDKTDVSKLSVGQLRERLAKMQGSPQLEDHSSEERNEI